MNENKHELTVTEMLEDIRDEMCNDYCKHPARYADWNDMQEEQCDKCPLNRI